ncbi:Calcitonin gene-related peptide type 1 receptor [Bagarius yarrelli]|uniref:Calcitonin gene-related peptide type 1 receptor n=1 Tax=Bagarius yarrelli TaxID=175774 RepID=A0A556U082_BAGYA|nr:Calcitonin gene-related peptide type 1 receptor [Bagarius yarrelli]
MFSRQKKRFLPDINEKNPVKSRFRHSLRQNLCVSMLQEGFHLSFKEFFSLLERWKADRLAAGPDSMLWLKLSLEEQPHKLETLKDYLTRAEAAQRADQHVEVYDNYLALANFFSEPDDTWLREHFYKLSLKAARKVEMDSSRREAEANAHLAHLYLEQGFTHCWHRDSCSVENTQLPFSSLNRPTRWLKRFLNLLLEITTSLKDKEGLGKAYKAIAKSLESEGKTNDAIKHLQKYLHGQYGKSSEYFSLAFETACQLNLIPCIRKAQVCVGIARAHSMLRAYSRLLQNNKQEDICELISWKETREEKSHETKWPYCNRTWDGWLCWGDSAPGTLVQSCPTYFQDFDPAEKVTKVCNPDGQWFRHPDSNRLWSNYTLCSAYTKGKLTVAFTMYYLAVLGHTLSVVSLLISIFIFSYFKCLSCQRISLHKNMFLSFIFNSILMVISLTMIVHNEQLAATNQIGCKILSSLIQYASCSTYFWMLCEGIYLHTLIIVAVFVGEQQLGWYYLLGWGFPVIPAVIHAVARLYFHDDNCWIINSNLLYIVHGPIHVAPGVRVLITKLRVTHRTESNAYMKAVRATLILVPLMGAHFILVPLQPEGRLPLAVYEFFMNIFMHFQVHSAIRRKLAQYRVQCRQRLVTTDSHSHNYNTNSSVIETSRGTLSLEHMPPQLKEIKSFPATTSVNGQSNGKRSIGEEDHKPKVLESSII